MAGKKYPAAAKPLKRPSVRQDPKTRNGYWAAVILVITFIVFVPSLKNQFISFDDIQYVTENPFIKDLSRENLETILLTDANGTGNYHPLTMLSLAVNYYFSGLKPMGYHLTNVFFHLINTFLVFYLVFLICIGTNIQSKLLISIIASLLFGIHPMHVESVAWVSGRKDVLFTLFYLLSLIAYIKYLDRKHARYLILSLLFFVFSTLSKGMAVTLPIILVIMDYLFNRRMADKRLIAEKIPFFLIAILFGIVTIITQRSGGATEIIKATFFDRTVYASFGLTQYIIKLVFPYELCAYYPYPEKTGGIIPLGYYFCLACPVIILLLLIYFLRIRQNKNVLWGILFFIINLLLVLQLLPVGSAVMADRYAYLSSIGFFFLAGIFISWSIRKFEKYRIVIAGIFGIYFILLVVMANNRCLAWRNSTVFWEDVARKYPRFAPAINNLGIIKEKEGDAFEAINYYSKAIEVNPSYPDALFNRGILYGKTGQFEKALPDLDKAILLSPGFFKAYLNRGIAKASVHDYDGALKDFDKALLLQKGEEVYYNRGILKLQLRDYNNAIRDFTEAIKINHGSWNYYYSRGLAKFESGRYKDAVPDFSLAINLHPANANSYYYRAIAEINSGEKKNGCEDLQNAMRLGRKDIAPLIDRYCR